MNKFSLLTTMITPFMLLSGCVKEKVVDETDPLKIQFSAEETSSRAAIGNEGFPDGSAFSVWGFMTKDAQTANVFEGNTVTKGTDNNWTCDATRYWFPGWNYDFYAVYPSKDFLPSGTSANVTINEQNNEAVVTISNFDCSTIGDNAVDLMTAIKEVSYNEGDPTPGTVELGFQHLLSKVSIVGHSEGSDAYITSISLTNVKTKGTYTYSETNGGQWTIDNASGLTPKTDFNLPSTPTDIFGDLLLIPQSVDGIQLSINYNYPGIIDSEGNPLEKTIVYNLPTTYNWESGKSYRYSFTLSGDYIIFDVPQMNPWKEASGGIIIVG